MVYSGIYHSIFCVHSIFYARIPCQGQARARVSGLRLSQQVRGEVGWGRVMSVVRSGLCCHHHIIIIIIIIIIVSSPYSYPRPIIILIYHLPSSTSSTLLYSTLLYSTLPPPRYQPSNPTQQSTTRTKNIFGMN